MTGVRAAYRQKIAYFGGVFARASGNAASAPHIGMQMACFEAAPSNLHVSVLGSRPGVFVGPRLWLRATGPDGRSLADAAVAWSSKRNYPLCWRVSALDSGVIITPVGGRYSCAALPFFSLSWRLRRLPAAWKPKVSAPLPAARPGRSSPMRPTRTWLPGPRLARWPVGRPATPVSAVPATEPGHIHPPARVVTACRHRGFPPRWRFVSPALTAHDITKGGAGQSAPGGRD